MGFLSKLFKFEKNNLERMTGQLGSNPERLLLGAADPFSTKVWNGVLGTDWEPVVNEWGGATDESYADAVSKGIDIGPGAQMHGLARIIAGFYAGKAATDALGFGGEAAGGSAGSTADPVSGYLTSGGSDASVGALGSLNGGGYAGAINGAPEVLGAAGGGMNWTDWANLGLKAFGAYQGYQDNKDQQQTQTRDPWTPAQPWILENIGRGQAMQQHYAANPFSPQQQTAYNNIGSLLNLANTNAPGLLQGFQANAQGANNFDRSNPRRSLLGSAPMQGDWSPGLLSFFQPKKGG